MLQRQLADQLPHRTLVGLILVVAAVMAPHLWRTPIWVGAATVAILGLRAWISRRGWRLPPTVVTITTATAASAGVWAQYGTILGRDAGVALLVLMAGLKLMETRSRRDTMIAVFLAYFVMLTHFLFDQSLVTAGYMLLTGWATTAVLIAISHRHRPRLGASEARLAGVLVLQGLPVMVLLFVLFPRLPGPLWGRPDDARGGVTGISESMSPGGLSELSRSDAVAFRVRFDEPPPPPRKRYWRGLVMTEYDGESWSRAEVDAPPRGAQARSEAIDYTITLEPHNERWLFALDLPAPNPQTGELSFFHERRSEDPVRETLRYRARSYTEYQLEPELGEGQRRRYTQLPDGAHPQARQLATKWRDASETDAAVVDKAMNYFRDKPFEYTLTPEPIPDDVVDGFLFETRSGFCEHYAGALTVLMRAAGIPARVVAGYQGAERAASGDFWTVRQSDAHAWSEVWLPGQGWRRVDPTSAVSEVRIESGLGAAQPNNDAVPTMARGANSSWLRQVRRGWDVVDATWTSWVISYGPNQQEDFLESIGLDNILRLAGALLGGVLAVTGMTGLIMIRQQMGGRDPDPARRLWHRAQRQLGRRGLPPHPGEGPRDYANRVARTDPDLAATVREITRCYLRLRYYPDPDPGEIERLRTALKQLRRRPRRSRPINPGA